MGIERERKWDHLGSFLSLCPPPPPPPTHPRCARTQAKSPRCPDLPQSPDLLNSSSQLHSVAVRALGDSSRPRGLEDAGGKWGPFPRPGAPRFFQRLPNSELPLLTVRHKTTANGS